MPYRVVISNAREILGRANKLVEELRDRAFMKKLSIPPRLGEEIAFFIASYATELERDIEDAGDDPTEGQLINITAYQHDVELAVRFIQEIFLNPREHGSEKEVLRAADWLCVEGFRELVGSGADKPLGPIVVIESSVSPLIWSQNATLPIPSLFTHSPQVFERESSTPRTLPKFPVVCLPGSMTGRPHDFPLLSHEVGHAVDTVNEVTASIKEQLTDAIPFHRFWKAWMREIIADVVGVYLSGEAFVISFCFFTLGLKLNESLTYSEAYPGFTLRLTILEFLLKKWGAPNLGEVEKILLNRKNQSEIAIAEKFLDEFESDVFPLIEKELGFEADQWPPAQKSVWELADEALRHLNNQTLTLGFSGFSQLKFLLLPSVMTVLRYIKAGSVENFQINEVFRQIQKEESDSKRPDWVAKVESVRRATMGVFGMSDNILGGEAFPKVKVQSKADEAIERHSPEWMEDKAQLPDPVELKNVPSIKPTKTDSSGKKIPPVEGLKAHDHIVFVGATNGQLLEKMKEAQQERKRPWKSITLYFASRVLLGITERNELSEIDEKVIERNRAIHELKEFLEDYRNCERLTLREFDGPSIFGSFWDWDKPGGFIHISAQIPGIDIRECPGYDHFWPEQNDEPSEAYQTYLNFLAQTQSRSRELDPDSTEYQNA